MMKDEASASHVSRSRLGSFNAQVQQGRVSTACCVVVDKLWPTSCAYSLQFGRRGEQA